MEKMSVKYKTPDWKNEVETYRLGVNKCLLAIRSGTVDENNLDALSNFCQYSLALMVISGSGKWDQAKDKAELASFLLHDC
jgi:hypothetical protein